MFICPAKEVLLQRCTEAMARAAALCGWRESMETMKREQVLLQRCVAAMAKRQQVLLQRCVAAMASGTRRAARDARASRRTAKQPAAAEGCQQLLSGLGHEVKARLVERV